MCTRTVEVHWKKYHQMPIFPHLDNILFSVTSKDKVITDFKAKLLASPGYRSLAYGIRYLLKVNLPETQILPKQTRTAFKTGSPVQQFILPARQNRNRFFFSFGGLSVSNFMILSVSSRLSPNLSCRLSKRYLQSSQVCLVHSTLPFSTQRSEEFNLFCDVNQFVSVQKMNRENVVDSHSLLSGHV